MEKDYIDFLIENPQEIPAALENEKKEVRRTLCRTFRGRNRHQKKVVRKKQP